ncbi:nitric-oxide reductase large subunit [Paracidobacterium acidisoli]|uniref:Nitric-oxide reductase large subunit n=1 Tax=Paracidobacterium acidisoli TaxID=2303751 RepID=A0A372IJM9_9BACT|nr:nitric-oxide reductase large subunit [Paracidobacterium acidisoli]MBT9333089.1 nitric-oxide reductase large subunit [Paracidobacterium acidisoli]
MKSYKRLWIAFGLVIGISFAVLGTVGHHLISHAPPVPARVVTPDGAVVFTGTDIVDGQGVWQSIGGQEIGTIWGHGAYVAPDWTADWLHRESIFTLDNWAQQMGSASYSALSDEQQGALQARLRDAMRRNTYDAAAGTITISPLRAEAFSKLEQYYAGIFAKGRDAYAIPAGALTDTAKQRKMAAFFWWTAWAATTDRPGESTTYTNNWPHESLVGNEPTPGAIVWSIISFVLLLAAVGGMVWYFASKEPAPVYEAPPASDPLLGLHPTPSQKATIKYFYVAALMVLLQIACGIITAHYGVEGSALYGIPLAKWLPYSISRTWHLQLAIFWIATSWLATGLYVAPAVSGFEPKGQRLGVNLLFGALVVVVGGSLAGEWLGIEQKLGNLWFWFGSQGYEYVDLGRFWQILLFAGLTFWLWLMWRALRPALSTPSESRPLLALFLLSSIAIPLFYASGLMYGQRSNLVTAEYWRWWVVHLWVEGFFEVFATVVIAFLFTRLRLLRTDIATSSVLFSTIIFLSGGIIGTFHHLYFAGTGPAVIALGALFSALEVVPLVLIGFEAWENIRLGRERNKAMWIAAYKWPIRFFVAVAFWNFIGAGLFGFLINPPVALYYLQGLNTTPVHGHTALFGVYGMLGLGLMLFCLRALHPGRAWKDRPLAIAFWCINTGLSLMVLLSMLPVGLLQGWASVQYGTWYARSSEFLQTPLMNHLRWMRVPGDTIFALGMFAFCWFLLGLLTGHSYDDSASVQEGSWELVEAGSPGRIGAD